jgi:hypothetical protein
VFGFARYWRASVATDRAAHRAGCRLVAVADTPAAPMAEGADLRLLFEASFSSLSGAVAIAQCLTATFALGGGAARRCLKDTEASRRLSVRRAQGHTAMNTPDSGPDSGASVARDGASRVLHRSLREMPPVAVGGRGIWLVTKEGREVLDASGGAAVSCLGHQHQERRPLGKG